MARRNYWVQYIDGMWHLRHNQTSTASFAGKQRAIDAGVSLAQTNQPSSLKICRMDGTIEDERTYGDDPFPPRG